MEGRIRPVLCAGMMTLMGQQGVDVGPLEARKGTFGFIENVNVKKGKYYCHYALSEDAQRVEALIIVSETYEPETLEANEKLGDVTVALSGVAGFFASPKKEYSMQQMGEYLAELEKEHEGKDWVNLNSKQFFAPTSQGMSTRIPVYAHRDEKGEIDAIQMEFNRSETELLAKGLEVAIDG